MKLTKKRKAVQGKVEYKKLYNLEEASKLIKEVNLTKFDSSVDIHVRLGLDPTKADQALRGSVTLPHGVGKTKKVLVMCNPDKESEAKNAGADYVGLDEYVTKIEGGWLDFDVVVATPTVMIKIGKLGKILGPRNLMPNPKTGTVTNNVGNTIEEIKAGKISFKIDKASIIHSSIGRVSFDPEKIKNNALEFIENIVRIKPSTAKGNYIKSIALATTMSPSIFIDFNQLKL